MRHAPSRFAYILPVVIAQIHCGTSLLPFLRRLHTGRGVADRRPGADAILSGCTDPSSSQHIRNRTKDLTCQSSRFIAKQGEVGAFYWTALAPVIVNPGREEQGSVSV